jgi:hypothetical protein
MSTRLHHKAEIDPSRVDICHCTDCQTLSGSAYRTTVPVEAEQFTMWGTPTRYSSCSPRMLRIEP